MVYHYISQHPHHKMIGRYATIIYMGHMLRKKVDEFVHERFRIYRTCIVMFVVLTLHSVTRLRRSIEEVKDSVRITL